MPFSASTSPMAALCLGEMEKSAHFTSQTVLVSNQTSGMSVSEYLHDNIALVSHQGFVRLREVLRTACMHTLNQNPLSRLSKEVLGVADVKAGADKGAGQYAEEGMRAWAADL